METTILALLFALVTAYGVVCAAAPRYSMHLDGTAARQGGADESAVRVRKYGGLLAVAVGVAGSAFLFGPPGVLVAVVAGGAAALWTSGREPRDA
ncbi:hypothetical protein JCM17823_18740 [Halorubrum gandharaense]